MARTPSPRTAQRLPAGAKSRVPNRRPASRPAGAPNVRSALGAAGSATKPPTTAYQSGQRRRQLARRMRRFEAMLPQMQLPAIDLGRGWNWQALASRRWGYDKFLSLLLLLSAIGVITWMHTDLQWFVYRENVEFQNLTYLNADQLYEVADVDSWNIFWLQPAQIRERLVALPTVDDATVSVRLPNRVQVHVQEAQPVAQWVTQQGDYWVLANGAALSYPAEEGEKRWGKLLRIIDNGREARFTGDPTGTQMDPQVLASALALIKRLPDVEDLHFNQGYGLNFRMPESNVWVYWGDGQKLEQKLKNLKAIRQLLLNSEETHNIVDVRFDKPVIQ